MTLTASQPICSKCGAKGWYISRSRISPDAMAERDSWKRAGKGWICAGCRGFTPIGRCERCGKDYLTSLSDHLLGCAGAA